MGALAPAQVPYFLLAHGEVRELRTRRQPHPIFIENRARHRLCGAHRPLPMGIAAWAYWPLLLMTAAAAAHTASSCEPVPPEQPIAPMILPFSVSGIPPRDAMTSSRLNTYL